MTGAPRIGHAAALLWMAVSELESAECGPAADPSEFSGAAEARALAVQAIAALESRAAGEVPCQAEGAKNLMLALAVQRDVFQSVRQAICDLDSPTKWALLTACQDVAVPLFRLSDAAETFLAEVGE
ncbi:MAG: hypothetical protein IKP53_08520 [Candidatus Methanomethylophilaceae archaeon]|nr:hypothetical protein [Candidatus Methanomethylophilaceae archaeon]